MSALVHLLTGSTGIAAATAERLVARGDSVFIASRTDAHVTTLVERLARDGASIDGMVADLRDEAAADGAVAAAAERFGRLDGVLSIAGGSGRRYGDGTIDAISAEGWDRTIELNLRSQALVARAAVRQMLDQASDDGRRAGALVLVSSVLATHPEPTRFGTHAYAAAKGAIESLARAMASSYADRAIRVNVLAPGLTATPMASRAQGDPTLLAFARRRQPLVHGLIDPAAVADAAVFLLTSGSAAITGQVLAVDGGWGVTSASPSDGSDGERP